MWPCIGMRTSRSQRRRTAGPRPRPSLPTTIAIGPRRSASRAVSGASPSAPTMRRPRPCRSASAPGRSSTGARRRCSTAPAEALTAAGVSGAWRWVGKTAPWTPVASARAEERPDVLRVLERVEDEHERRLTLPCGRGEHLVRRCPPPRRDHERDALVTVEAGDRGQRAALDLDDGDPQARGVEDELLEGEAALRDHEHALRLASRDECLLDRAAAGDQLLVVCEGEGRVLDPQRARGRVAGSADGRAARPRVRAAVGPGSAVGPGAAAIAGRRRRRRPIVRDVRGRRGAECVGGLGRGRGLGARRAVVVGPRRAVVVGARRAVVVGPRRAVVVGRAAQAAVAAGASRGAGRRAAARRGAGRRAAARRGRAIAALPVGGRAVSARTRRSRATRARRVRATRARRVRATVRRAAVGAAAPPGDGRDRIAVRDPAAMGRRAAGRGGDRRLPTDAPAGSQGHRRGTRSRAGPRGRALGRATARGSHRARAAGRGRPPGSRRAADRRVARRSGTPGLRGRPWRSRAGASRHDGDRRLAGSCRQPPDATR